MVNSVVLGFNCAEIAVSGHSAHSSARAKSDTFSRPAVGHFSCANLGHFSGVPKTLHIRRNAYQFCKGFPVPWMRQVSTGADLRSVRFGYSEGCGYDPDFDSRKERLNLSDEGFLIQPNWQA